MTSRLGERTLGILAGSCVIILVMLIVLLWTGVGTGMFNADNNRRTNTNPRLERLNRPNNFTRIATASNEHDLKTTTFEELLEERIESHGTSKAIQLSISEDKSGQEVEYVKPVKISSLPLHEEDRLYGPDQWPISGENRSHEGVPPLRHHSGHFRHKMAQVWDPHPQYEFTAFGRQFRLFLTHDSSFVAPDLQVTHIWNNHTTREHPGLEPGGCFYTGMVVGDPQSSVAVSLCHGMTGHIYSSSGSFFIEPAERWRDHMSPILHAVYRNQESRVRSNHVQDTMDTMPHCGVIDESEATSESPEPEPELMTQFVGNRSKRSVQRRSSQVVYSIEIMVVADKKMAEYHGSGLNHYILSLMHTVNKFYKHASVGNPISIAVVKIMVLKEMDAVAHNVKRKQGVLAPEYLRKFCAWQSGHNAKKEGHYDTALLLTRENLCRSLNMQKCDTLGLAELGTMCHKLSSCSIVRDNGLSAAFTIAHELGHVLNMPHDDDERCRPFHSAAKMNNVMSRMLDNNTSPYSWSNCSRHFVTEFLDAGSGDCLTDTPFNNEVENTVPRDWLPGENFTEDQQCELVNGKGSKICSYMPVCSKLWCGMDFNEQKGCKTNHMPWADGTSCGSHSWCQQGECVYRDRKRLEPVNGGWGAWQDFGECSRTCGGGIKKAVRFCDNPKNVNGGQYCLGPKVRYRSCQTQECPVGSKDFREAQCAEHNGNNYKIHGLPQDVTWVPKYGVGAKDRCTLYCRVSHSSDYFALSNHVIDGTKCGPDTFDMCINGMCRPSGCNHIQNPDRKPALDLCGKCGGDNSTCHWINGNYNVAKYGYNDVIRIPAGAANIDIRQTGNGRHKDDNYLALVDGETGEYLLNGKYAVINYQKVIPFANSKIQYSGSESPEERLNSTLPIDRDLILQVLSVAKVTPPNISYKYTATTKDYRWIVKNEWTECDKVCNGEQRLKLTCIRVSDALEVESVYCSNMEKPNVDTKSCNNYCILKWHVWSRTECSSHCGPGFRNLSFQCVQEIYLDKRISPVQESSCTHILHLKPNEEESCEGACDASHWLYGEWRPCPVTCGGGTQTRSAICVDDLEREVDVRLCDESIRILEKPCARNHCPQWETSSWTPCSVSCGEGERKRAYFCHLNNLVVPAQACHSRPKPEYHQTCNERPCIDTFPSFASTTVPSTTMSPGFHDVDNVIPYGDGIDYSNSIDSKIPINKASWRTGPWGECSKTCGEGTQRRLVKCQADNRQISGEAHCLMSHKPTNETICNKGPCPSWKYGMWGECNSSCGLGYRHRQVGCQKATGEMIKDDACNTSIREAHYEECLLPPCLSDKKIQRWKVGAWGPCSKTCGNGFRNRTVECVDGRCDPRTKPKISRNCKNYPCPNSWVVSDWTECSVTCGEGIQRRTSVCNAVEPLSDQRANLCNGEVKPTEMQSCHMPNCDSHFYWRANEWLPCSHSCGKKGRQIRNISCYHRTNKKVPRYNCPNESKPKRKRKCNQKKCTTEFSTCLDIQRKLKAREDREYQLTIHGRSVTLYCNQMASESPQEYLTLPNEKDNYAEIYDRRLLIPDSCPDNGERWDNCSCVLDAEGKAGLTVYKRIRLNVTSLRVHTQDVTHARQVKGTKVAYAESGDCYSRSDCPQGRFSVDLTGTPFKVSKLTQWEGHGSEPSIDIRRQEHDQQVFGKCGGYCGTCSPNKIHGLTLDWLQPP